MPVRSAPQAGIGLRSNSRRPFSRRSSIHCGSFFLSEMSADDRLGQAPLRGRAGGVRVSPAVRVGAERGELLVLGELRCNGLLGHVVVLTVLTVDGAASPGGGLGRSACVGNVPWIRDVRGAHAVAVRDGGQALDVRADELGDRLRFGLAQLRELGRHVRDRAVVLAELAARGDHRSRCSVTLGGERRSECLGPGERLVTRALHRRPAPVFERGYLVGREGGHGVRSAVRGDPAQRRGGQIIVGVRAGAQPGRVGQREHPSRAATAARTTDDLLTRGHVTVVEHRVEVAADRGRAEAQGIAQLRGGRGAVREEQLRDPIAGTAISTARDGRRGLACLRLPHLDRWPARVPPCFSQHQCDVFRPTGANGPAGDPRHRIMLSGASAAPRAAAECSSRTMCRVNAISRVHAFFAAPVTLRRLALGSLVANIGIVVTGGAVRLSGSGLGCPTWPRCTDGSYVTTAAMGYHGEIEFTNRTLTSVVSVLAVACVLGAWLQRDRGDAGRRGRIGWSVAVLASIPAQAVLGGLTVLTDLNPWLVALPLPAVLRDHRRRVRAVDPDPTDTAPTRPHTPRCRGWPG